MNKYLSLSLLWGISVLLCMETKSASIPETSSSNSTSEPNQTTTQASTSQVLHNETETQHTTQHPTNNPVATSAVATDTRVSPTVETQEANVSGKKDDSNVTTPGLDVSKTAAATASSLPHVLTSTSEAPSSHNTMMKSTGERLPVATTKSTTTTAEAPTKAPKRSTTTECQPCSTLGVVKQCLIIIASLAGLATIFMVSTIVLCVKLSGKKYKVNKRQQGTEMMCISSLMPERNYSYTRQRNPISNGVLVIPTGGDSDEEGGDNLTLSSFLPENDRFV
uniref:Selectin P ligand n=1 Tax=Anabas testudineus TaxID=64144 RepID=A0A3Q1JD53_ANATE